MLTPAFRLSSRLTILATLLLLPVATGCGSDDDNPTGPGGGTTGPVTDEVIVSLDEINIVRDCDGGAGGEFAYKFYIDEYEDGEKVRTHLSTDWNSFSADNFTAWDPNYSATFQLERRSGVHFNVRVSLREFDSFEHFSQGEFVRHDIADGRPAWTPTRGNGSVGYNVYDAGQQYGEVQFLADVDANCQASMTYSVTYGPAGS